MYEFIKKEVRSEFKETDYGKRTNMYLYVSLAVWFITFVMTIGGLVLLSFIKNNLVFIIPTLVIGFINSISLIIMVYFDGKRDGAIKQFEISKK